MKGKLVIKKGDIQGHYRVIFDGMLIGVVKHHKSGLRLGTDPWVARDGYGPLRDADGELRKFRTRGDAIKALWP